MATRSPPYASESRVRGLDVGAGLENHLARNWEVSGCVAIWQREERGPGEPGRAREAGRDAHPCYSRQAQDLALPWDITKGQHPRQNSHPSHCPPAKYVCLG